MNHSIVLSRQELWPVALWQMEYPLHREQNPLMKAAIDALWQVDQEGAEGRSNPTGWQSKKILQTQPAFQALIGVAIDALRNPVASHFNWDLSHARIDVESWANVNPHSSLNQIHAHAGALISGAYYIKVPPDSGAIRFYNPRKVFQHNDQPPRKDLSRQHADSLVHRVVPVAGQLLLFPGWLPHDVEANFSGETRYSISFNIHAEPAR
jgi:uncharacterized protein (TIGR02466 family)